MGVNVAKDREQVTVHTMNPVHRRGPVFYASLPRDTETSKGQEANREEAKHRLVSLLWDHLATLDSPLWTSHLSSNRAAFPIQVLHDPLGKPHLLLGAHRGPAISFSEGGGKVWAALCGDDSNLGIDVAEAVEFHGNYPFHRAFNSHELQHALNLAGGELEQASALLWSVKEAVVKALGCAFHFVDPLQIHVCPSIAGHDEFTFPVRLLCSPRKDGAAILAERWQMVPPLPGGEGRGEGKGSVRPPPGIGHPKDSPACGNAPARFPIGPGLSLWVRSFPLVKMWLSIAVLNRHIDTATGQSTLRACSSLAATRRMPHWQPLPHQAYLLPSQRGERE